MTKNIECISSSNKGMKFKERYNDKGELLIPVSKYASKYFVYVTNLDYYLDNNARDRVIEKWAESQAMGRIYNLSVVCDKNNIISVCNIFDNFESYNLHLKEEFDEVTN